MRLKRLAALIDGDRLGQRRLAAFERADDLSSSASAASKLIAFTSSVVGHQSTLI